LRVKRKRKTFDCVEFQHEAAGKVAERMGAMTLEQRLEYERRETEAMRRQRAESRAAGEAHGGAGPLLSELMTKARSRPAKRFDCVELQHQAGRKLADRLRDMTPEEQAAYLEERMEELRKLAARTRGEPALHPTTAEP
jgi:hypothetical protein